MLAVMLLQSCLWLTMSAPTEWCSSTNMYQDCQDISLFVAVLKCLPLFLIYCQQWTVFPNLYSSSRDQKLLVPTYRLFQSVLITSALPVLFFFIHEILRVLLKTKSLLPAVLLASSLKESMPWYHTAEPATHDEVSWFLLPNSVTCLTTHYWYCNNCSCHLHVTIF